MFAHLTKSAINITTNITSVMLILPSCNALSSQVLTHYLLAINYVQIILGAFSFICYFHK